MTNLIFLKEKEVGNCENCPEQKKLRLTLKVEDLNSLEELIKNQIPADADVEIRLDVQVISLEQRL